MHSDCSPRSSGSAPPRLRLPPSVGRLKPTADARNVWDLLGSVEVVCPVALLLINVTSTIRGRRPCREADQAPRTPASRYLGSMNPLGPLALQGSLVVNFIGWHGWPNLRLVIARRRRRCFRLRHRRLHRGWHRRPNLVLAVARTEHLVRWVPQPHRVGRTGPPRHRWTTSKRACSTR